MHIGLRIKRIRKIKKLEQSKVCDGIVSTSHYSNIESGRYVPSEEVLRSLAERLDVPASYFLYSENKSSEVDELIEEYNHLLEKDINAANDFLHKNKIKFEYIQSIEQEVSFQIHKCIHLLRKKDLNAAEVAFEYLSIYIDKTQLDHLSREDTFFYYYCAALLHFHLRNFKESTDLFNKSLLFIDKKTYFHEAKIRYNIALIKYRENDIRQAIKLIKPTINAFIDIKDWKRLIGVYSVQGVLYGEVAEYEKAIEFYEKALQICNEYDYESSKGIILHNLGVVYFDTENYDLALECLEDSLINKYESNGKDLFVTYISIIVTKLRMNKLDGIHELFLKSKSYCTTKYEEYQLVIREALLAYIQNDYSMYEKKMVQSLDFFHHNKYWLDIEDDALELSEYYYQQRKYKNAYYYLNMEIETRDHLYKQRAK